MACCHLSGVKCTHCKSINHDWINLPYIPKPEYTPGYLRNIDCGSSNHNFVIAPDRVISSGEQKIFCTKCGEARKL